MENVKQSEEKRCVACKGKLVRICEDVYLRFDTPFQFFQDGISMDVFECENCHRLDFYNSSSELPPNMDCDEMEVCPDCGQEHSKHINCPHCAAEKGFTSGFRGLGIKKAEEKKERRKKNDVPWEL